MLDYQTALAVYQYESWQEAAYATFQSPSSVSKRVSKLEKELGVRIFDRASRASGTVLTPTGAAVMPYIRRIVDGFNEISAAAEDLRRGMQDHLRVGYQFLAGSIGTEEMLAVFRALNPDINITHLCRLRGELSSLVRAGELDCAFILGFNEYFNEELAEKCEEKGVTVLPYLKCETLWMGMRSDHPLAQKSSVCLSEIADETMIVNSAMGERTLFRLETEKGETFPEFRTRAMDYSDSHVLADYIASGGGMLPVICMPPKENSERIAYVKVSGVNPRATAYFLCRGETQHKALRAMLGIVKDYAEGRRKLEYK